MSDNEVTISRDAQVLMQSSFRNTGSSISLGNQQNFLSERSRLALKELIEKKVCSYEINKKNNSEEITCVFQSPRKLFGERMTEEDDFPVVVSSEGLTFKPII